MAEADCTEFAASIAKLALRLAENDPNVQNLDGLVAQIQTRLPVTREIVSDAIVAFTSETRAEQTNALKRQLAAVKQEARTDAKLRKRVESLEQQIASGVFDSPNPRQAKAVSEAIATLRQSRDKLAREAQLRQQIDGMIQQLESGEFVASQPRVPKVLNEQIEKLAFERRRLRSRINRRIDAMKPRSIWKKMGEPLNLMRSVLASSDLSAVFRQGGIIAFGNPGRAAKSIGPMFRALFSEKKALAIEDEIRARPNAILYDRAGLRLTELDRDAKLTQQEEMYMSRWARYIPLVRASERAYVTFLNKLRADSFDTMVATLARNGEATLDEMRAIANFVNVATGRGNLGRFEASAELLNTTFFAPRYVMSRFQFLTGQPLWDGTSRTRKLVTQEYAKYLTGFGVMVGLAIMSGADVEWDPRSSDWVKFRFGDSRVDLGSGLLQPIVLVSKVFTGESKGAVSGKVRTIAGPDKEFAGSDAGDTLFNFLRTKFSPGVGLAVDLADRENVIGEPVNVKSVDGLVSVGVDSLVPISFQSMYETFQANDVPKATALSLLEMFGAGLATFSPDPETAIRDATAPDAEKRRPDESREDYLKRKEERESDRQRALELLRNSDMSKDEMRDALKEQFKKRGWSTRMVGKNGQPTSYARRLRKINALP